MSSDDNDSEAPPFDSERAAGFVGKRILVGVTYCDHLGNLVSQSQFHGTVVSATTSGIMIELEGERAGTHWNMPPDLRNLSKANPGEYRLRETGEVVVDPDFIATWTVTGPPPTIQ